MRASTGLDKIQELQSQWLEPWKLSLLRTKAGIHGLSRRCGRHDLPNHVPPCSPSSTAPGGAKDDTPAAGTPAGDRAGVRGDGRRSPARARPVLPTGPLERLRGDVRSAWAPVASAPGAAHRAARPAPVAAGTARRRPAYG